MRFHRYTQSADARAISEDVEIDVTPIMNMFVILIPFLVSMAVFTHLAVLRFSLPPHASAQLSRAEGMPKPKPTVVVAPQYVALTLGEGLLDSIVDVNGKVSDNLLVKGLSALRVDEGCNEIVVAARDSVKFERIVTVMDQCTKAGFSKIGLSEGTSQPSEGI